MTNPDDTGDYTERVVPVEKPPVRWWRPRPTAASEPTAPVTSSAPSTVLVPVRIPTPRVTPDDDVVVVGPAWARQFEHGGQLSRRKIKAWLRYWRPLIPRILRRTIAWLLKAPFTELIPISCGFGKLLDVLVSFTRADHWVEAAKVAAGTPHAYRAQEKRNNTKRNRGIIMAGALAALVGVCAWLYFVHPDWLAMAAIVFVGLLDAWGRRSTDKPAAPPHKPRPLIEGMSTRQLVGELRIIFTEEGYEENVTVHGASWDIERREYRAGVTTYAELKPELLRTIERRLSAPEGSIRVVGPPNDASNRTLVFRLGNPLAKVPEAPWHKAGTLSAWHPLDLGLSNGDQPFELVFAGRHIIVVAKTGGGKTEVHFNNSIDRLAATEDAVIWGISLVKAAAFVAWRSVIQEKAFTVEEADVLLDMALEEIARRDKVLQDIAEDDDPDNDTASWIPELGPALIIFIDEYPQLSKWNGTKLHTDGEKYNLLAKTEQVYRTGRGLAVTLVIGIQKTGNDDTGSTVVSSQSGVFIVGPCDETDTVNIFGKEGRDAGIAPHLLHPAVTKAGGLIEPNDAGMAVVKAPGFGSDYVRGYKPFSVKRRAMRREQEWRIEGNQPFIDFEAVPGAAPGMVRNAEVLPPALTAVDGALKHHNAGILCTELVLAYANSHGEGWTPATLAEALRLESPSVAVKPRKGRCRVKARSLQCYHRVDVATALAARS